MEKTVLIIEDEAGIADTITYALSTEGIRTLWASTGQDGLAKMRGDQIDLIVLDIGLPDVSGLELIKDIRKESDVPVLFLTARSEEIDRVLGFELGGDDYVVKPFSPRELTVRIKAILRRSSQRFSASLSEESPFIIDSNKKQVRYFGEKLNLSRYEYEILCLLIKKPGWVYTREKIMELIWEEPEESFERTVDTHIKTLRSKLKEIKGDLDPIITHRGYGYALKENL